MALGTTRTEGEKSQQLFPSLTPPLFLAGSGAGARTRSKSKGKRPANLFDQPPHPKLKAGRGGGRSAATGPEGRPCKKAVWKKERVPTAAGKSANGCCALLVASLGRAVL